MRLLAKEDVKDSFGAGKLFTEVHPDAPESGDGISGVEGNGVDAKMVADVEGSLVVELLRYNGDGVLAKDLLGADHRVEGAETGIVKHNAAIRNALGDEVVFHVLRLVVGLVVIVAADKDNLDLPSFVEVYRGSDAVDVVDVRLSGTAKRAGAKKQANVVFRDVVYVVKDLAPGAFHNNVVAPDNYREADDAEKEE